MGESVIFTGIIATKSKIQGICQPNNHISSTYRKLQIYPKVLRDNSYTITSIRSENDKGIEKKIFVHYYQYIPLSDLKVLEDECH